MTEAPSVTAPGPVVVDRRTTVLTAALSTFARFGFRKTSMEQIAHDADISRPGLYFLFESKQVLFREAVEQALREDLAAVNAALAGSDVPLRARMLRAFDHWAGRYTGPLTRDIAGVIEDNPEMLGPVARSAPQMFARMIVDAVAAGHDRAIAEDVSQTLISTSIGIKHQVDDRGQYLQRLAIAVDLLLPTDSGGAS